MQSREEPATRSIARGRFEQIAASREEGIDLALAALWIAAEERDGVDVDAAMAKLDALASRARGALADSGSPRESAEALNRFLFQQEGFSGNRDAYYDPCNSYLDQVLIRRTGIPISLALVYLALGSRLGLPLVGVSFPGHFLIKWGDDDGLVLDPFDGRLLSLGDCQRRLDAVTGGGMPLDPAVHLRAAAPREILVRVLGNLKRVFAQSGDYTRALSCCERALLLLPDVPAELKDRATIYEKLECPSAALADLELSLELAPEDPAAPQLLARCDVLRQQVSRLH